MATLNLNIKRLFITATILLSVLALPYTAQAEDKPQGSFSGVGASLSASLNQAKETYETTAEKYNCSKECSKVWSTVDKGGCRPLVNKNNIMAGSASGKIDSKCLREASTNSCFDSVPITAGTGNYNTIGNRWSGTRNHYGTDIGATGYTNSEAFAVADGTVALRDLAGGSGQVLVINHPLKCTGGVGSHSEYHSVYRHLYKYGDGITVGAEVFKRGNPGSKPIGIVGGSNYTRSSGKFCQNPTQTSVNACPVGGVGGTGSYAIHLHLELAMGHFSGSSTQASTSTILQPYCQNVGVLCGGCPMPEQCKQSGGGGAFGDASALQSPGDAGAIGSSGGADTEYDKTCKLSEFLNSEGCIFCGLFRTIFNVASVAAKTAMDALSGPSKKIVGIGFLIWILAYLFKHVATPAGTSTGEMLKGILFQGFRVAVVAIILTSALHSTMDLTLNPVLQTGLSFAQSLNSSSTCPADADYMKDVKGYDSSKGSGDSGATGGLSTEVGKAFVCSVKNMEDNVGFLMGIGKYLLCVSWHEEAWPGDLKLITARLIPHLGYFFNGLAYYLVGLMLVLCAPWCLIDCVLQLCIAAGLIPCAIAAFAFKSTEKYLKIIWNFFMNAMFNFVFMAIILYIINSYLKSWMGMDLSDPDSVDKTIFIDPDRMAIYGLGNIGGAGLVIAAATGSKFRLVSVGGIVVVGICFLCWSFFDEAKEMAERFANSPSLGGRKGIGKLVGGTLASAGTAVAKPVLKLGSDGVQAITDKVGSATNSAIGNKWRSGMNRFKGRAGLLAGRAFNRFGGHSHTILNDEGETVGYESSFNILGRRISQKVQKDDSGMWVRETDEHKSNAAERAFEKKYDARGKVEQINLKDENGNNIKDENGNDVMVDAYSAKHRVLGVTYEREDMQAFLIDDKIVYRTADDTRGFTMGENGEMAKFKTRFTDGKEKEVVKHSGMRTVNDGFMQTSSIYNSEGETIRTKTNFSNESSKYLVNQDGTINTYAMTQMQNGTADRDTADAEIINRVLQARGQGLSNVFSSRRITRGNDGSFVIEQTDRDARGKVTNNGRKTIVTAKMIDNIMVIDTKIIDTVTDKNGKVHNRITHTVSNGMKFKTETYTQNEKGGYNHNVRHGFANHVHAASSTTAPLDKNGNWGNNIDRDKAMTGFTDADYKQHVEQLKGQDISQKNISVAQMQYELNANTADMGVAAAVEYEMLYQKGATETKPVIMTADDGAKELRYINSQGVMIKKNFDKKGNQTNEFQYNPAENTRRSKTFATKEEDEPRQNGNNPNTSETRESERPKENDARTSNNGNKIGLTEDFISAKIKESKYEDKVLRSIRRSYENLDRPAAPMVAFYDPKPMENAPHINPPKNYADKIMNILKSKGLDVVKETDPRATDPNVFVVDYKAGAIYAPFLEPEKALEANIAMIDSIYEAGSKAAKSSPRTRETMTIATNQDLSAGKVNTQSIVQYLDLETVASHYSADRYSEVMNNFTSEYTSTQSYDKLNAIMADMQTREPEKYTQLIAELIQQAQTYAKSGEWNYENADNMARKFVTQHKEDIIPYVKDKYQDYMLNEAFEKGIDPHIPNEQNKQALKEGKPLPSIFHAGQAGDFPYAIFGRDKRMCHIYGSSACNGDIYEVDGIQQPVNGCFDYAFGQSSHDGKKYKTRYPFGFIYEYEAFGDKQEFHYLENSNTELHEFTDGKFDPQDLSGSRDETSVLPYQNELKKIYIAVEGNKRERRIFPLDLDENGEIADKRWRDFVELHRPVDDTLEGFMVQRQNNMISDYDAKWKK